MARIRSIKPEFWVSEQVAECSTSARLTFVGLWNFCDDRGVHPAKPKTLKAELYPMDDCTAADVAGWVGELIQAGLVRCFQAADGEEYWHVTGWEKHQKIDRPSYKYPEPMPSNSTSARRVESTSDQGVNAEASTNARRAPPPGVDRSGVDRSGGGDSPNPRRTRSRKTTMPTDFGISNRVKSWAADKGHTHLDQHLEAFRSKAIAKGYAYVDWDEALMGAIRDDWAKLRQAPGGSARVLHADDDLRTGA